jgi:polysaccharide deacetylase 2 family uncharacterized protein YibQ
MASLPAAPHPELVEASEWGNLPKKGATLMPKGFYARPLPEELRTKALVSIVITGIGANKAVAEKAIELPPEITLVFTPYARLAPQWVENARNAGHEAWLALPTQPADFPASDPGPLGLLKDIPSLENHPKLMQLMGSFVGYVGIALPEGEVYSENPEQIQALVNEAKTRGIAMFLSQPTPREGLKEVYARNKDSMAKADFILDTKANKALIQEKLEQLVLDAQRKGHAVGLAHGYPVTLEAITEWAATAQSRGITLAPLSAILGR